MVAQADSETTINNSIDQFISFFIVVLLSQGVEDQVSVDCRSIHANRENLDQLTGPVKTQSLVMTAA